MSSRIAALHSLLLAPPGILREILSQNKQTNKQTSKKRVGDREMAQHLRVFAHLAEDLSVVFSTHDSTLEPTELHLWEF